MSIVIADLLIWYYGAQVHQMEPPALLAEPLRGLPVLRAYSSYRLFLLPLGIAIGVLLWLFLNRTRVGMMIRAGVDDRGMLSASGVNVNLVFAITFAIGAGLAGFGGVIGAVELSMVPGEDTRLLLASLVVVIVGGMGSVVGAAVGAAILGLAETFGLAYAPTYSVVFTFLILVLVLAFRPRGILGRTRHEALRSGVVPRSCERASCDVAKLVPVPRISRRRRTMSAADWRQAMNSGAGRRAMGAARPAVALRTAATTTPPSIGGTDTAAPRWVRSLWRHVRARHVAVLLALLVYPLVATPFFAFQIGGQALALGIIALSLSFLGGYGGMISLAQMTVAGIAGYLLAILGTSASEAISLNWPWYVAVPVAVLVATLVGTLIGWLSVRTEGIYTIMITLAIGVAFHYLALQNYSVFNGFQGHQRVYPPNVLGIDWRSPVPFFYLCLFFALASYFLVKYVGPHAVRHRAAGHPRQPAAHELARLPRDRASRGRVRVRRPDRGDRRRAVHLVQRPGHAGLGRARAGSSTCSSSPCSAA